MHAKYVLSFTENVKKSKGFNIEAHCNRQTAVAEDTYGKSVSAQNIQDSMLPSGTPSYDTIETELNWNMSQVC